MLLLLQIRQDGLVEVQWPEGKRIKPVQITALRVYPLPHDALIVRPSSAGQRVLVLGGARAGRHGTVAKFTSTGCHVLWEDGCEQSYVQTELLHTATTGSEPTTCSSYRGGCGDQVCHRARLPAGSCIM